jgi:hypothetical protein
MNGTRLSAMLGGDVIGYIEVEIFDQGERLPRSGGWADLGNLSPRPTGVAGSARGWSGRQPAG